MLSFLQLSGSTAGTDSPAVKTFYSNPHQGGIAVTFSVVLLLNLELKLECFFILELLQKGIPVTPHVLAA